MLVKRREEGVPTPIARLISSTGQLTCRYRQDMNIWLPNTEKKRINLPIPDVSEFPREIAAGDGAGDGAVDDAGVPEGVEPETGQEYLQMASKEFAYELNSLPWQE
jgi:hypothetical protein